MMLDCVIGYNYFQDDDNSLILKINHLQECRGGGKTYEKTNIPFHVADDPLRAVARGTGIALKNINRFSFLMK